MVDRFKGWLRKKLRSFLEIDEDLNILRGKQSEFCEEQQKMIQVQKMLTTKSNDLSSDINAVEETNYLIQKHFNVAVDVGISDRCKNWGIICIKGNMDYVKFIDMSQRDIMEIARFLKRFEHSNRHVDAPMGMKETLIF